MARTTEQFALVVAAVVVTVLCICPAARATPKFKVLHTFTGSDGEGPYSGVIVGQDGNLYGTTVGGGSGGCCGTVFQLAQQDGKWSESVLYTFQNNDRDGDAPYGNLIFDAAGNLYGTTSAGGTHVSGVAFELNHTAGNWEETVLYNFCSRQNCSDGGSLTAGLVMDQAGNLYGTAHLVFELLHGSDGWKEKVLHRFTDWVGADSGLILDASGNLYGVTEGGGVGCASQGCGFVYELMPTADGKWEKLVLHRFDNNGKDGYTPGGGALIMDGSGSLYGTTETGGCCGGTVFKLTPGSDGHWKETILHNFKPGSNGSFPTAGVVMDKAGNLYGTTVDGGGACDCGVVYKLAPGSNGKWKYTVLHRFNNIDGAVPAGNLTLDGQGNLYGGTVLGGGASDGVIFEITP